MIQKYNIATLKNSPWSEELSQGILNQAAKKNSAR